MAARSILLAVTPLALFVIGGCFNPSSTADGSREGDDLSQSCHELDDPCTKNGDCCDFDTSVEVGTALCVDNGSGGVCSDVCTSHSDCASGCCGQLTDQTSYGACSEAAVCDAGYGFASVEVCLHGVDVFCSCGESLEAPCSADDRSELESACTNGPDGVTSTFECFAGYDATTQCGAALDACG